MIREGSIDEILKVVAYIPEFKDPYSHEEFNKRLSCENSLILVAKEAGKWTGFKCGYEEDAGHFYSWMGGVVPAYRRKGVADKLLKEMEGWCRVRGYEKLKFKTLNQHKSMLLFAIKRGFEIIGVEKSNKDSSLRIWLFKDL